MREHKRNYRSKKRKQDQNFKEKENVRVQRYRQTIKALSKDTGLKVKEVEALPTQERQAVFERVPALGLVEPYVPSGRKCRQDGKVWRGDGGSGGSEKARNSSGGSREREGSTQPSLGQKHVRSPQSGSSSSRQVSLFT